MKRTNVKCLYDPCETSCAACREQLKLHSLESRQEKHPAEYTEMGLGSPEALPRGSEARRGLKFRKLWLASDWRSWYGRWPPVECSRHKPASVWLPEVDGMVKSIPLIREKLRTIRKPPDDEGGASFLRERKPRPSAHTQTQRWVSGALGFGSGRK